ncbi:MAG: zinc-dependent metalloprotease, partial [Thermoanaerobaculia bacterium]
GGEAWNKAFESAGFKNALQIRVQPDDAEWDAGDIRYNVLRWTSSPNPQFGGYGPHFENPRTGQTIGADIMLEYVFLTNRMRYSEIFSSAGLDLEELDDEPEGSCSMGQFLHRQTLFGMSALMAMGAGEEERDKLIEDAIYRLILHEIGHTLGLNHNMKASQLRSLEDVHNRELTQAEGITASVMDYPALNIAGLGKVQGEYYDTTPGPYDHWAIEYGYSEALDDPQAEAARLKAILNRSSEPALMFGNDADDMRRPGRGIDPRVMIGDLSSDSIGYAVERMQLINDLLPKLEARLTPKGESYQRLLDSYLILTAQYSGSARVVSRHIGGVYVDRSMAGQVGAEPPYQPVPASEQRRAMAALEEYVFSPRALSAGASLYSRLQPQRRGFDFGDRTEDPKIHARTLTIQQGILEFLLDTKTLTRISDSRLYGNQYELTEVLGDLTNAVFAADVGSDINSHRQNLQIDYVKRLVGVSGAGGSSEHDFLSQSAALAQLREIRAMFGKKKHVNNETRAHTNHLLFLIGKALAID